MLSSIREIPRQVNLRSVKIMSIIARERNEAVTRSVQDFSPKREMLILRFSR
jgi:hypothetical protein